MAHDESPAGRLMRELRTQSSCTLDELAKTLKCSKGQLSLMESGQRTISVEWSMRIEKALGIKDGRLTAAVEWESIPPALRAQIEETQTQSRALQSRIKKAMESRDPLRSLRRVVRSATKNVDSPLPLRGQIPIINKVAAGYPAEFTDLDYPAAIADDYIACPDVDDPDAFAARVVGDSMEPEYCEGDLVVFSPQLPTPTGSDCFVRLERDNETTFKRVYFEDDGGTIRLQPLNNSYPPQTIAREDVSGMYAAAYVMRRIGR